ncbi:MAG: hypothetical protein ABI442_13655 [Gemmatimonadaceae bacterium]
MNLDPNNRVVALCVAGMAIEGTAAEACLLFEQAWDARSDDYDACIAAHFVARHRVTPEETLRWNLMAVQHAEAVVDGRAAEFMASLYLNLGDANAAAGNDAAAFAAVVTARAHLSALSSDGYRNFVTLGIDRLERRLTVESQRRAM